MEQEDAILDGLEKAMEAVGIVAATITEKWSNKRKRAIGRKYVEFLRTAADELEERMIADGL